MVSKKLSKNFNLQPVLKNDWVMLTPLMEADFEALYRVASDPLVWEQHPNKDRYKKEVFTNFFKGAMESGGAFLIKSAQGEVIGCSRYYDLKKETNEILIGYTFFGRNYWGGHYNRAAKSLMINHAFQFVNTVVFHIGAGNIRSQRAIEKLGATKTGEEHVAYYGEPTKLNFVYKIERTNWMEIELSTNYSGNVSSG
jgi:RimJ/RimL family protein N-acetyltransferase